MNVQEELKRVGEHPVVGFKGTYLGDIYCALKEKEPILMFSDAYTIGKMHGKREERAKKTHRGKEDPDRKIHLPDLEYYQLHQLKCIIANLEKYPKWIDHAYYFVKGLTSCKRKERK